MSAPVIAARGLTKRYGKATVVDGIDFDVAKGEIFGLLGPNGAGKTTLFRTLLGLQPALGGSVLIDGMPLAELTPEDEEAQIRRILKAKRAPTEPDPATRRKLFQHLMRRGFSTDAIARVLRTHLDE